MDRCASDCEETVQLVGRQWVNNGMNGKEIVANDNRQLQIVLKNGLAGLAQTPSQNL